MNRSTFNTSIFVLCALFYTLLPLHAEQYVIETLNGEYITYRGKRLTKGSTFEDKDSLVWDNATALYARNTRTGNVERIRQSDFTRRRSVPLWNYFVKINHGSSRVCGDYCMCSAQNEVVKLTDTVRMRIDDPDIIDVCLGRLPVSALPNYYMTYRYNGYTYTAALPLEVDELIITKQTFSPVCPPSTTNNQQSTLLVSVFSIDRTGKKNVISDAMVIEIN